MNNVLQEKHFLKNAKNLSQEDFIKQYSNDIIEARLNEDAIYQEVDIQLPKQKLTIVWKYRKGCYQYYGHLLVPTAPYKVVEGKILFEKVA